MFHYRRLAVLVLALSLVTASVASAQTFTQSIYVTVLHRNATWSPTDGPLLGGIVGGGVRGPGASGVQIQNLDPAVSANVVPGWWPQTGGRPVPVTLPAIPPLLADNSYLPAVSSIANGLHALIVHADRRIAAVARTEWPQTGGAVLFSNSQPSRRLIVPLIACKYAGQTAFVSIQNTDESAPTTVETKFFALGDPRPFEIHQRTISAGTSITFSACRPDSRDSYVGYLTAEAPVPVTAQAFINVETSDKAVFAFEGLPAEQAAQRLYVPLFRNSFFGTTGISVVNPGPTAAQVTVQFAGSLGNCAGRHYSQGPATIQPGASAVFYQAAVPLPVTGTSPLPNYCAGGATIEAAGGNVVAVVNDASGNPAAPTTTAAYGAISTAQAGRQVALPLFRNRHTAAQLTTGIQAMNVSDASAHATIRFTWSDGTEVGGATCGPDCQATIAPGASFTWYPPSIRPLIAGKYGSAFIDSDQPLAVIVNDASLTGAMDAAMYNGLRADAPAP